MRKRIYKILAFASILGLSLQAGEPDGKLNLAGADSEIEKAALGQPASTATMYIWADKYVYQPGEQLTLRWTVRPNQDLYPYTIVLYRQNNQTGVKTYLPGNSQDVTDIYGNTASQGFRVSRLPEVTRGVLVGDGGLVSPTPVTIPDEPGMHTFVVQLRDYTGGRVIRSAYFKIGVVTEFVNLSGNIESDLTLVNTKAYRLSGAVFVRNNAVLTIEPGTFIFGQPGSQPPSVLVVTRNGRIVANGTRSRPIVMTSSQPFGQRQRGDWGGLILLGRAPINVAAGAASQTNQDGEFYVEGLPASEDTVYGGGPSPDPNHNCGSLRYVRVEYAGSIFAPNNEANSFTWAGCGKATVAEYLQAIYGLDDSFEWFGGTSDAKYLVGAFGADDYIDWQLGYTGRIQFGVFYQSPDSRGNRGIEGDNSEYNQSATPLSKPVLYNLTFIGSGQAGVDEANSPGIYLRRGSGGEINNALMTNFFSAGVFIDGSSTQSQIDNGNIKMDGVLLWNNGLGASAPNTLEGQVDVNMLTFAQGSRGNGRNFVVADPMLRRPFDYSDPDFRPMALSPVFRAGWVQPPDDGFFDQTATWIGAFGSIDWTEEWTNFLQDSDIRQ